MTVYVGGGFVCEGATGYEDGDDVVPDYDAYDWEFDYPLPPPPGKPAPPAGPKGERVGRRDERTREHPQFAKKYNVEIDLGKLREALEWLTSRSDTPGAVRWDDIYDKAGEVAGVAFWVGFGPDVQAAAIHDGLLDAFRQAGVDVSQTLIGADNLRRGLERDGGLVKQSFFRVFIPHEGWKLLQDWTILREDETRADVRPEIQDMVRERQRARRLEIIEALKDIRVAEVHAAELARERAAREAAEARAAELARELERQDRALIAVAVPRPVQEMVADELAALFRGEAPPEWLGAAARAVHRLEHPPPTPRPEPARVARATDDAIARAAEVAAKRSRQRPTRPPPAPRPERAKPVPAVKSRKTAAERRLERKTEARRLDRRARYLEQKAGRSRTREANEARREAKELRAKAARLKR